jgi:hypothetical protein
LGGGLWGVQVDEEGEGRQAGAWRACTLAVLCLASYWRGRRLALGPDGPGQWLATGKFSLSPFFILSVFFYLSSDCN